MKPLSISGLATGLLAFSTPHCGQRSDASPQGARPASANPPASISPTANELAPNLRGGGRQADTLRKRWNNDIDSRALASSNQNCRARVEESGNKKAVYTVVDAEPNFCAKWVGEMTVNCPGVQTLLPSENFIGSFTIPNDVLASTTNAVLFDWVSSEGNSAKSTADCAAATFKNVIKEYKSDPFYKLELGAGIAVASALVIGLGAYVAAKCLPQRTSATVTTSAV